MNPFSNSIPGADAEGPPTDIDDDGKFEDVNGDNRYTFDDVIALAFVDTEKLTNQQRDALDFDHDGNIDFDDVVELAFER
jgi:PKD repeat protein